MTADEVKDKYPDAYAAIQTAAKQSAESAFNKKYAEGIEKATQAERDRCASIVAVLHNADIAANAIIEGADTGTFFKQQLLAERQERQTIEEELLETAAPVTMTKVKNGTDLNAFQARLKELEATGVKGYNAYEKIRNENNDLYQTWLDSANKGGI